MRYAVLILALLGGTLCTALAWYWKAQLDSSVGQLSLMLAPLVANDPARSERDRADAAEYAKRPLAVYVLAGAGPLAFLGGLLAAFRKGLFAGPLLAAAGVGPIVIIPLTVLASGVLLLASVMAFFVRPARRKKTQEEEPEEQPAPRGKKIESEAIESEADEDGIIASAEPPPPPPVPVVRIGCPKCKTALRIPNPQAGKLMKCSKCGGGLRIPEKAVERARAAAEREAALLAAERAAEAPIEEEEEPEEEQDLPKPPLKRKQKAESMVPAIIASVLLVGCSAAASGLIVAGVLSPEKGDSWGKRDKRDRPDRDFGRDKRSDRTGDFGRDKPPDREGPFGDDPAPDPAEESRLAAQREKELSEHQKREKQAIARLRKAREEKGEAEGQPLLTFSGHKGGVKSVAWSPDGQRLASSADKTILVWDLTGKPLPPLEGHTDTVALVAFSPTGSLLASRASENSRATDTTLRLWDARTGAPQKTLPRELGAIRAFAWSPDGKLLFLSTEEGFTGKLKVCDLEGVEQAVLGSVTFPERSLAWSPDGATLADMSHLDKAITLWDAKTFKKKRILNGSGFLMAFAFSPDSKVLYVLGDSLQPFDVRTGKPLPMFEGKRDDGLHLAISPDGKWLVSNAASGGFQRSSLQVWDAARGKAVATITKLHSSDITSLAFSPGGSFLATSSGDNTVKLWDVAELVNPKPKVPPTADPVEAVKKFANVIGDREDGYSVWPREQIADADLATVAKLPHLIRVALGGQRKITDAGLAHLKTAKSLQDLVLGDSGVTAAGLAAIAELKQLRILGLSGIKLGDKGLESIKALTNLTTLRLSSCDLTDAGLAPIKGLTQLAVLDLVGNGKVTDAGVANLTPLTALKELSLAEVRVTDTGLAHLKGMTRMEMLTLSGAGVTDAGFAHLAGMVALSDLELEDLPNLKGGFLRHLKGMSKLTSLGLESTGVTDEGLRDITGLTQLANLTLPQQITDAGFVHLAALVNLESLNGISQNVKGPGLQHLKGLKKLRGLPLAGSGVDDAGLAHLKGLTQLQSLFLPERITDAGLAHLAGLTNLKSLSLIKTGVTDAGMVHLKAMKSLTSLSLFATSVGDAGLAHLEGLTSLTQLNLFGTRVSDAGLAHLKGMKTLLFLNLGRTQVGDAGVVHLKELSSLGSLYLAETKITDAGLKPLMEMEKLNFVDLTGTRVTVKGIAQLKEARPKLDVGKE